MTTNMADVLKLAARPTPHDNDERTWLEFRFKLENYLTLVNETYLALLQDRESQLVANVPACTDEASVLIRTLSHTLYAFLVTLTTGRGLRLVQRVPNRNGFGLWRQLVAESAPKTAGRRFAMLQAVMQPGMGDSPAKFEEAWKTWQHQVDVHEKLATSKQDGDVKISVVLREAPTKLPDNLLVNSQQFESNYNKLRAIIQAYLNSNKSWTANDLRNDTKDQTQWNLTTEAKATARAKAKATAEANAKAKAKTKAKPDTQDKECHVCGKEEHFARDVVPSKPIQNSERGGRCKSRLRCSNRVCVCD